MGVIQVSADRWMDKQNVVYPYNGILSDHKKGGLSDTCYNMVEPWGNYAEWNKLVTKGQVLCDSTYMRYLE